jgi:hypothetical protein
MWSVFYFQLYQVPWKACQENGESAKALAALQLLFEVQPTRFRKPFRSQHLAAITAQFLLAR